MYKTYFYKYFYLGSVASIYLALSRKFLFENSCYIVLTSLHCILSSTCTTAQTTAGPTWSQLIRSSPPWISPHTQVGAQDGSGKLLRPQPWYKLLVEKELQAPLSISFKSLARSQRFIARDLLRSFISTKEFLSPSTGLTQRVE